jgi:hypothetical protein
MVLGVQAPYGRFARAGWCERTACWHWRSRTTAPQGLEHPGAPGVVPAGEPRADRHGVVCVARQPADVRAPEPRPSEPAGHSLLQQVAARRDALSLFTFTARALGRRTVIFPLRIRGGKPSPITVVLLAFLFCTVNGYIQARRSSARRSVPLSLRRGQARTLTQFATYPEGYLSSPRFLGATAPRQRRLCAQRAAPQAGCCSSRLEWPSTSTATLTSPTCASRGRRTTPSPPPAPSSACPRGVAWRGLAWLDGVCACVRVCSWRVSAIALIRPRRRAPGSGRFVSGANFMGEIVEWCGFALACGTYPAAVFAVTTAANIGPRAFHVHSWCRARLALRNERTAAHRRAGTASTSRTSTHATARPSFPL